VTLIDEVKARSELPRPAAARMIRETAGISRQRLGAELGVTRMTVARWENGQRRPRGQHLLAYAQLLNELKAVA
jgi:transcriptional regulator with XRE-family HTH domain